MNDEIFYVLMDDHIVTRHEVDMAFYVTHGYHNTYRHEQEFLNDMQVEKLAQSRPILAVKLYRDRYGCTLREAREYVENLKDKS